MKLYWILFIDILLVGTYAPCEGFFRGISLQDVVDELVDTAKYQLEGISSLNDSVIWHIWSFFKSKYHRHYISTGEEKERLHLFRDHLKYVLESNFQKLRPFQLELNEFADWTVEEFNSLKKGLIISTNSVQREIIDDDDEDDDEESVQRSLRKLYQDHYHLRRLKRNIYRKRHPNRRFFTDWFSNFFNKNKDKYHNQTTNIFDWRTKNVVSGIKNQRKCGCCYAFATASILETLYTIKTNSQNVIEFSAQQILDCSSNGNNGCRGGGFVPSIRYLLDQGGKIATEASYPYAQKQENCKTDRINQIHLGNIEYGSIPEGDEKKLVEALTTYGPIFIGLDADSRRFMFYKSGVLKIDNCPTRRQDMDHAMVIIGHGYDNVLQTPYWIIKNSWGTKWGENGYLRLAKDSGNMCGVASMASYAKLT